MAVIFLDKVDERKSWRHEGVDHDPARLHCFTSSRSGDDERVEAKAFL